ncbi:MAG: T9SS type A sorting domain-containing protein, partial [Bacteroidota bacterium]
PENDYDDVQNQKDEIKTAIALLPAETTDDRRAIGSALVTAASTFSTENVGRRGIILFSAGNETEAPSALDPVLVLPKLTGADPISVYTMGFAQSPDGANLGSKLADATSGAFYETDITTISPVVNQIWDNVTGYQLVLSRQAISWQGNRAISWQGSQNWNSAISWQGARDLAISWQENRAISWQGSVDKGTAAMFPAISWQGKAETSTLGKVSEVQENVVTPKFHLALLTPDFEGDILEDDPDFWLSVATDLPGTISPGNVDTIRGVEYITGETYAFYRITSEYQWTREGDWFLVPLGANGMKPPDILEPVTVNGNFATFTDVVMEVTFDKSNYLPNEPVRITVALFEGGQVQGAHTIGGGPILDADVRFEVTLPNGTIMTRTLDPQGNGVYSKEFTNTGAKGTYDFMVTAEGTAPLSGEEFFRRLDQSVYVAPVYASAVLFAENSVTLQEGARIITGDVLVNEPAGQGVSVLVGLGASTPAGYSIKADRIQVLEGATVASTIYTNEDPINAGTITGTVNMPLELPVGTFPLFEPADARVGSAGDLSVSTNDHVPLASPAIRGDVSLEPHSSLTLEPGEYDFRSLRMKSDSKLYFTGPTKLRILYGIHADNGSYFGSAPGESVAPNDIIVHVEGTDVESASSYSVNFSPKSTILATLYAPNGTILLNQESRADGAFFGEDIVIGQNVSLRLASGFGALSKTNASGEPSASSAEGSVPKTYVLSQNYPNPFNPSTQIRYGLPRASHVNLIVYNMLGQEVVRLVDDVQAEGYHVVQWNGTNDFGNTVSSGMYIFRLTAGDFVQTKKMMLLK